MASSTSQSIRDAVKTVIENLSLTGIGANSDIVIQKALSQKDQHRGDLPGILIAPFGNRIVAHDSNQRRDVTYPTAVICIQASNQDQDSNRDRFADWQEKILNAFEGSRLSGVSTVWQCDVDAFPEFDLRAFNELNIDAGGWLLKFRSREVRS